MKLCLLLSLASVSVVWAAHAQALNGPISEAGPVKSLPKSRSDKNQAIASTPAIEPATPVAVFPNLAIPGAIAPIKPTTPTLPTPATAKPPAKPPTKPPVKPPTAASLPTAPANAPSTSSAVVTTLPLSSSAVGPSLLSPAASASAAPSIQAPAVPADVKDVQFMPTFNTTDIMTSFRNFSSTDTFLPGVAMRSFRMIVAHWDWFLQVGIQLVILFFCIYGVYAVVVLIVAGFLAAIGMARDDPFLPGGSLHNVVSGAIYEDDDSSGSSTSVSGGA